MNSQDIMVKHIPGLKIPKFYILQNLMKLVIKRNGIINNGYKKHGFNHIIHGYLKRIGYTGQNKLRCVQDD